MKENISHFTLAEIERLCRMYEDCQLSRLEETELEYVLLNTSLKSPVSTETRNLMGLSSKIHLSEKDLGSRNFRIKKIWRFSAAAVIAVVVLASGMVFFRNQSSDTEVCYAYVEGERTGSDEARELAMQNIARAEQFIQTVDALEEAEQSKVNHFLNNSNLSE
ncbi:MAG: hypothetical protein J6C81_01620 [Muribaculaceae bacterium]|nr:hypothetical protein [Muribaculaceae bacterium]